MSKKENDEKDEINNFNSYFNKLQQFFDEMFLNSDLNQQFFDNPDPKKDLQENNKISFGYSFFIGPEGKPEVKTWGNVKDLPKSYPQDFFRGAHLTNTSTIEPYVDVIKDTIENKIRVIVELPGILKEDINLKSRDKKIIIKAKSKSKNYVKSIDLPEFSEQSVKARFLNGILEVTLKPKKPLTSKKDEGTSINID
ncbi:MAG: Hsp20/alpha crystallin family protein [Candidatus Hodarchaeales archaeon]|jgi:HSP20 family protein